MANLSKRRFLKSIIGTAALSTWVGLDETLAKVAHIPAAALSHKEDFWADIRAAYPVTKDFIQLENGYFRWRHSP